MPKASSYKLRDLDRCHQGDILKDVEYKITKQEGDTFSETTITFPYVVILTQDCDLEQDFLNRNNSSSVNEDKYLQSILVCPIFLAEKFKEGTHLELFNLRRESWDTNRWECIKRNDNKRVHYLHEDIGFKMVPLVIDFKLYYTVRADEIAGFHKTNYAISINDFYREELSLRFSQYLTRIAIPNPGIIDFK